MKLTRDFLDTIYSWSHRCYTESGDVYDAIDIVTAPYNIEVSWIFKRNKSIVYNDKIKDSTYFYAKSLTFIQTEAFLLNHIKSRSLK